MRGRPTVRTLAELQAIARVEADYQRWRREGGEALTKRLNAAFVELVARVEWKARS